MAGDRADHLTRPLATLTRADGATAELRADDVWYSRDGRWAESLNMRFDPTIHRCRGVGGMPGCVSVVVKAAAHYGCRASYPWTGEKPRPGAVN